MAVMQRRRRDETIDHAENSSPPLDANHAATFRSARRRQRLLDSRSRFLALAGSGPDAVIDGRARR